LARARTTTRRRAAARFAPALLTLACIGCGHAAPPDDAAALAGRALAIPVAGVTAAQLRDTFTASRAAGRSHEAIDILAPVGTPVFAVEDGSIVKLFDSVRGGLTVYQFDPQRRFAHYYAHLDRYAPGLREGMALRRCDLIGYVGTSGNAAPDAPHLHFAVFRLGPLRQWWVGEPLNPYPALVAGAAAGVPCPG
jgi:murein DD-endopeptidase MepM/ murein hydrolase activator NlpD